MKTKVPINISLKNSFDLNKKGIFLYTLKGLSYKAKEINGKKKYYVGGLISTTDPDLVNDIVTQEGQDDMFSQLEERTIKLDYDHEAFRDLKTGQEDPFAITKMALGKRVEYERKENGVYVLWELNKNWKQTNKNGEIIRTFNEAWESIKDGFFDAFSIAFIPIKTTYKVIDGVKMRLLHSLRLLNVALTGNAINPNAGMNKIFAKSLTFLKNKEDILMKSEKEKKSYDPDGKHVHTENDPMGEHNHPELESELKILWEKIWDIKNDIYDLKNPKVSETENGMKSKKKIQEEKSMTGQEGTPAEAGKEGKSNPEDQAGKAPGENQDTEVKSQDLVDIKSMLSGISDNMKSMTEELKSTKEELKSTKDELKSAKDKLDAIESDNEKFKSFLNGVNHKGFGAENQANKQGEKTEQKSKGPLDFFQ